jgi:hypothetical protein
MPSRPDERRYVGRPLLRLLDCYVLALTGNLDPEMESKVANTVQGLSGGGSDWKGTLRRIIKMPDNMDERIKAFWRSQPVGTDPLEFAVAVSDENFLPMIDPD